MYISLEITLINSRSLQTLFGVTGGVIIALINIQEVRMVSPQVVTRRGEDLIFYPPPLPEFLTKDFHLQPGHEWNLRNSKENLVGTETAPTALFRTFTPFSDENQVSLVRTFLSDP